MIVALAVTLAVTVVLQTSLIMVHCSIDVTVGRLV